MEPYKETCYLWTRSEIRFRFTWERYSLTLGARGFSHTVAGFGQVLRVGLWPTTHTGPSSSRSHVITPNYIRLKIPKTIPCSAAHNPFASGWHINTNKWRQREYRYWGSIGFKLHCHSYSILYPLLHTVIAMIYLRSHYSPFSHRP